MWSEALSVLDRAERLQRQFFAAPYSDRAPAWEPPIDVAELPEGLCVQIALPGVPADAITLAFDHEGIVVSALRAFPCRDEAVRIHRVEIPYGRFERRIAFPTEALELSEKRLADGILTLTFRRKEGA